MKVIVKIGCCLVSAVLFLYLIVWDYPILQKRLDPALYTAEKLKEDADSDFSGKLDIMEQENNLSGSLDEQLETIDKQIEELEKQQNAAGCEVYLYFDQIFESGYEQLYPAMKEKGYTGTLVLKDGQLPGDNLQMTEKQCREMLDDGWELAIGGSEDIDMDGNLQEVVVKWSTYLKQYLKEIKTRMNVVPKVYCFNEGEYRKEFEEVLKEFGFTTIRYFADEELESEEDGLTRIRGYRVTQETEIADVVEELGEYSAVALSTRRVADEIKTPGEDIEIGRYGKLLDSMNEAGMYVAGSDGEKEYKEKKEALAQQIEQLKSQKKEIEAQLGND